MNIADFDAIYSGELLSSIRAEYSGSVPDGASWLVITDCPWAAYVEFGTGVVGQESPHPDTSIVGWKYDVNSMAIWVGIILRMANGIGQRECQAVLFCTRPVWICGKE